MSGQGVPPQGDRAKQPGGAASPSSSPAGSERFVCKGGGGCSSPSRDSRDPRCSLVESATGATTKERRALSDSALADREREELLRRRDEWRKANLGTPSSSLIPLGGKGTGGELGRARGGSSLSDFAEKALHPVDWPSIEERIHMGRGARKRLTLIPQKFSEWCVDLSGYHPTTHGGQERLHLQIKKEIKCNLFSDQKWVSEMRDLDAASDCLEQSIEKMMMLDSDMGGSDKQSKDWKGGGKDDQILNSVDSRFAHSWTPNGPGLGWFWIPKGWLCLDISYPASKEEVRRYGYLARKI